MYKKILVALDGSSLAEKGLESAISTANQNPGSELVLITVIDSSALKDIISYDGVAYEPLRLQLEKTLEEAPRKYMDNLIASYKIKDIRFQVEIKWGRPANEIIKYAEGNEVDLIVLTTRGRSGLKKLFLGSVAAEVISSSPVAVLVLPPDKK